MYLSTLSPNAGKTVVIIYYLDGTLVKGRQRGHGPGIKSRTSERPATTCYRVDYTTQTQKPTWVKTDDSTRQYGRQLAPGVYQFREYRERQGQYAKTIVLADYTPAQVENDVRAFHDSVDSLRADCARFTSDADWIIAECIFEQSH